MHVLRSVGDLARVHATAVMAGGLREAPDALQLLRLPPRRCPTSPDYTIGY